MIRWMQRNPWSKKTGIAVDMWRLSFGVNKQTHWDDSESGLIFIWWVWRSRSGMQVRDWEWGFRNVFWRG